jgi:hypothetical protein
MIDGSRVTCRSCGAEIAANAIVCYRCGEATAEPASRAAPPSGGRRWISAGVALAVCAVAAWIAMAAGGGAPRWSAAVASVVAAAVALWAARRR